MAGSYLESARNIARMRKDPPEARIEPFERTRIGVASPADARRIVADLASQGIDFLKIRTVENEETYRALNDAARDHGLKLVGHVSGLLPPVVLDAGQDGIDHAFYPSMEGSREDRMAVWRQFAERGVAWVPTLVTLFEATLPPIERLRAIVDDDAGQVDPTAIDRLEVDGQPPIDTDLRFPRLWVTADYFKVLQIPLLDGRMFESGDPPTNVIITEALARRLWPNASAIGRRFREEPGRPWNHVIGVVAHVRTLRDGTSGPDQYFQLYVARQPPPPPPPVRSAAPRGNYAGPLYGFLTITARVDSRDRIADLFQTVRSVDARNILTLEFVDDQYARQFADRLLATRIISGFGLLAFLIAAAGIYGLMTFLVAARTREIGIRMALGAGKADIRALVIGSSARLVAAGAVAGIAAAIAASRWIQSQLYGVQALDPLSIGAVAAGVVVVALLATWRPAHRAANVDPTLRLRG